VESCMITSFIMHNRGAGDKRKSGWRETSPLHLDFQSRWAKRRAAPERRLDFWQFSACSATPGIALPSE
jgi:hypothetical protein